jgi:hypothetical protein
MISSVIRRSVGVGRSITACNHLQYSTSFSLNTRVSVPVRYSSSGSGSNDPHSSDGDKDSHSSTWLSTKHYEINEDYVKSNAFGEKKSDKGFGRVNTPARSASMLTSPHVFVTNLRKGTKYQLLRQHMSAVGEVKYARVFTKPDKEYSTALVEYYSMEDAKLAMKEMHGSDLEGNSLWVREYRNDQSFNRANFD